MKHKKNRKRLDEKKSLAYNMSTNTSKKAFLVIIILIFMFPIVQYLLHILPDTIVTGVEIKEERPKFNLTAINEGQYQKKFESWFTANYGIREYLVKTNNQIMYTLLNEVPPNSRITIGKDRQLFETVYISGYLNRVPPIEFTLLEENVRQTKEMQDILKQRGIAFILLITPSKASIYPEYIPDRLMKTPITEKRNYDNLVLLLDKYGINYVDGHKITAEKKATTNYPMFCQGGTHWNYLAGYYTTEAVIEKIESLTNRDLINIELEKVIVDNKPIGVDRDLADLLNLWKAPTNYVTPHPELYTNVMGTEFKPRVLFIGGSFNQHILVPLHANQIFSKLEQYFYYRRKQIFPNGQSSADLGEITKVNWEGDIFQNDIIIHEFNEENIPAIVNKGFITDCLAELKKGQ